MQKGESKLNKEGLPITDPQAPVEGGEPEEKGSFQSKVSPEQKYGAHPQEPAEGKKME